MSSEDLSRPPLSADPDHSLIDAALARLPALPRPSYRSVFEGRNRVLDLTHLRACARRRGLQEVWLSDFVRLFHDESRALIFYKNMTSALLYLDRCVTDRKPITKAILETAGLPTAAGKTVHQRDELNEAVRAVPGPLVVKPVTGSGGRGVSTDLYGLAAVQEAAGPLLDGGTSVLIEEQIRGIDLRLTVVGGRVVGAALRIPAHVTADGVSSITELLRSKNRERAENDYTKLHLLTLGDRELAFLSRQSLGPNSVPTKGRRVFLHDVANISAGGDNCEVLPFLHPSLCSIAVDAAALFPSSLHAGVDMIVERLDEPASEQRVVICEVNLNNELPMHLYPVFGTASPVDEAVLETHWHTEGTIAYRLWSHREDATAVPVDLEALAALTYQDDRHAVLAAESQRTGAAGDLDTALLGAALDAAAPTGATVEFSRDRRLVFCHEVDRTSIREITGCTLLSGAVAASAGLTAAVARRCGIPVIPQQTLPDSSWQDLCAWVESSEHAWDLRYFHNNRHRFYGRVLPTRSRVPELPERFEARLTESPVDAACVVLMAAEEVLQAQILEPLTVVGDGVSSLTLLVDEELSLRAANPALARYARGLHADALLEDAELSPGRIPNEGARVRVGRSPRLADGGAPIGIGSQLPWPELGDMARRFHRALGTAGVATVTFAVSQARSPSPVWALWRYSARPRLAPWKFPLRGIPYDPYPVVAGRILHSPSRLVDASTD